MPLPVSHWTVLTYCLDPFVRDQPNASEANSDADRLIYAFARHSWPANTTDETPSHDLWENREGVTDQQGPKQSLTLPIFQ